MIAVSVALAGAWTRGPGEAYVKLAGDAYHADRYVLPDELPGAGGVAFGAESITAWQAGMYAELGLSDGVPIQVSGRLPFVASSVRFAEESSAGPVSGVAHTARLGDLDLALQVGVPGRPLAVKIALKAPLYEVDRICAGSVFRDYCGRPGDGQVDATASALAGASLWRGRAWIEGELGYRRRTEVFEGWTTDRSFGDGLVASAVLGAKAGPVVAMLRGDGARTFVADPWTPDGWRVGPAAMVELGGGFAVEGRFAVELGVRNASSGAGGGLGVSWRRPAG